MLKWHLTLFPTPLSSNLCHLLASQDPYFPGLWTTLLVGSKGLSWMKSHPHFLQWDQESHKVRYSALNSFIFMNSINYLPLSPGSKLMLHADVVVLYRPTNSPEDINIIQEDINQILNWTKAHSLILNSAKTFYLSLALPIQFTSILDQISSKLSAPGCYHSTWLVMENTYTQSNQSSQIPDRTSPL